MTVGTLYLLLFLAMGLSLLASIKVQSSFARWKKVPNASGMSGAEAALAMLRGAGLHNVAIEPSHGFLSDHYDPSKRVLRLSPDVYQGRSVASVGVALHEAGHALQHASGYAPLSLRTALVPVASIGSGYLPIGLIVLGLIMQKTGLAVLGLGVFAVAVLFTLITLPVEFNASARAKQAAVTMGIVSPGVEAQGVSSVLNAAALTYVAAAFAALINLLYWASIVFGGRRD